MRLEKDLEDSVKKLNKLINFRAFSIGASVAVMALACGSSEDNNGTDGKDEAVVAPPAKPTCEQNPLLAECVRNEADVDDEDNNGVDDADEETTAPNIEDTTDPAALARADAENVLATNCGECHGSKLQLDDASGGMNYIDDIDKLVENGKIIPLNSKESRIVERMRDGSMPPSFSQKPRVTDQEIDVVAQFIDQPRFWPNVDGGETSCPDQLFTFDDLYQEVASDLRSLDADDALTTRYISLTNRFTAGVCKGAALDRERNALFKMVNMLSTETTVEQPEPVNPDETIYRIDLEDYGWDKPVTVVNADGSTTDFTDKWEAIIANNQYAVEFVGDDADDAKLDSNTTVPVLFADSLLDAATIGNLYYALIDVDVQDTLDNFILNTLDIDVVDNLEQEDQVRAGTTKSRISRQDRVVERDEIGVRQGVLWQSFDFEDDANDSIFEDPFNFAEGGTEAIFTLPNGFFGFIIADANSAIVEDSDILLDTNQNNFRAVTSISCSNCHAQGLIPVIDEVREIALANARTSGLNNDEVEQLRNVYPEPADFARIVLDDSTRFFKSGLSEAGVTVEGGDPVASTFFRFDQDITLEDAAGDLGLTPDELQDNLNDLNPELNVLDQGRLDRDDFTQFYIDSLCILSLVNENQPDPNVCADVAAQLAQ
jgi:mono/diheme cytochrome c family protein